MSSYKKGKQNEWKAKAASGMNTGGTDEGTDKSPKAASKPNDGGGEKCQLCGKSAHHEGTECPALKLTCHNCNKGGHFKAMCRSATNLDKTSKVGKVTIGLTR